MLKFKLIILVFFSTLFLSACSYELVEYKLEDKVVTYNEESHTLTYDKELGNTKVVYENNEHTEVGEYIVKATFNNNNGESISEALLTILPKEITIDELVITNSFIYNGLSQSIYIEENENFIYSFKEENSYIEVGEYYNTVYLESVNKNYLSTSFDIKVTITEELNIVFNDKSFLYDNTIKSIEIDNIPDGYKVIYSNNNHAKVGEYIVKAEILDLNNNLKLSLEAKLTIYLNDELNEVFNTNFNDEIYTYNEEYQTILLTNHDLLISYGYNIEYINNVQLNSGSYEVEAIITKDNIINNVNSTFVINKKILYPSFIGDIVYYEDEVINLKIDLDIDVEYFYYHNNEIINTPTKEGEYIIEAVFNDQNYVIENVITNFSIILNHSILNDTYFDEFITTYNYNYQSIYLSNHNELIENNYEIEYINNKQINSGTYEVKAVISKSNFTQEYYGYIIIEKLKINPNVNNLIFTEDDLNISIDYNINHTKKFYDIEGNEIDKPNEVGLYKVKVKFDDENYYVYDIEEYFVLTLNEKNINLVNEITFEERILNFNDSYQSIYLSNHMELIRSNFHVRYFNNKQINSGTYEVRAVISKGMFEKEFLTTVTINKLEINLELNNTIFKEDDINIFVDTDFEYQMFFYDLENNIIDFPLEIGRYKVLVIFNENKNYIINNIEEYIEITLSENNLNLINNSYFIDNNYMYNYSIQTIYLNNHNELLDNNFNIEYVNNEQINSDTYDVLALITKGNYIKEINYEFIINKLNIELNFIELDDIVEGLSYHFFIDNNLEIDYIYTYYYEGVEVNKPSTYGTYQIKASFYNYDENLIVNDIYYTFNIILTNYAQSLIDNTSIENKEVLFNDNFHSLNVSNHRELLQERFNILYKYNDDLYQPKEAGEYNVVATIYRNGVIVKVLYATLTII